jgi:hypothetical protein
MPWDHELAVGGSTSTTSYSDPYMLLGQVNESYDQNVFHPILHPPQQEQQVFTSSPQQLSSATYLDVDHAAATSFFTSPRAPPTHDDDPAMFLSSPARRFGFGDADMTPVAARVETRRPYHFQTEESERDRREKELKLLQRSTSTRRPKKEETTKSRSQTVKAAKRLSMPLPPSSVSHSRHSSLSTGRSTVAAAGVRKTAARRSPIKPLSGGLAAPMESVVLKIGKDGRAKTEMITQSSVPQYLDDGSDTESDSDDGVSYLDDRNDDNPAMSFSNQNTSFNVPDFTPRRGSLARSSSRSRPHSKSSSYSSTVCSSHSGRHSPWASSSRGSSRRLETMQREGRGPPRRHSGIGSSSRPSSSTTDSDATQDDAFYNTTNTNDDDDDDANNETGDAQHALMQVLKQRSRPMSASKQTGYRAVQPNLPSSPPLYRQDLRPLAASSPAEKQNATPKGRHANPISGTRCVCNSKDNGGHLMIQWYASLPSPYYRLSLTTPTRSESCTHWLHTKCVGLDRQSLPAVYICLYCTQTPPQPHGGHHLRESTAGHGSSPLARKSFQHRDPSRTRTRRYE